MPIFQGVAVALNTIIHTTGATNGPVAAGPYPGVYCAVYLTGTQTLALIRQNPVVSAPNPFLVNADGRFLFEGVLSEYDLVFSATLPATATPLDTSLLTEDEGDARYAPLVHAPRHASAGADPVSVTSLAGFPGGAVTFLRADATFAAATGSGAPAAHHASHETGGSDAITALAASVITTGTMASARLPTRTGAIGLIIDGGGSALTTGVKGDLYIPFAGTITASTLIADVSGSVVLSLLLSASYATVPVTSIVASAPPTLSSALNGQDTTLTGWTVSVAAGSRLRYSVTSASTITRLTHMLTVTAP